MDAPTRREKSQVIQSVVRLLLKDTGARFFKRTKDFKYVELQEKYVRQKVQHALRDMAAMKLLDPSSSSDSSTSPDDRIRRQSEPPKKKLKFCQTRKDNTPAQVVPTTVDFDIHFLDDHAMMLPPMTLDEKAKETAHITPISTDASVVEEKLETRDDDMGYLDDLIAIYGGDCDEDQIPQHVSSAPTAAKAF